MKAAPITPIADRYVERRVQDGHEDWTCIYDRATASAFLVGSCSRETQLRILKALNFADRHMEEAS